MSFVRLPFFSTLSSRRLKMHLLEQLLLNMAWSVATLISFPFFSWSIASEQTRVLLTSAAFVHLKEGDFSKHTRNLAPASRAILLSGPAGKLFKLSQDLVKFRFIYGYMWLRNLFSLRVVPANACEGFSSLFWCEVIVIRYCWFFSKGKWTINEFSLLINCWS